MNPDFIKPELNFVWGCGKIEVIILTHVQPTHFPMYGVTVNLSLSLTNNCSAVWLVFYLLLVQ